MHRCRQFLPGGLEQLCTWQAGGQHLPCQAFTALPIGMLSPQAASPRSAALASYVIESLPSACMRQR